MALSGTIMAQIVHGPAILDDQERYPFGNVLGKEYPYPKNQGEGFYEPKDSVKDFFVAGLGFVVGDVSKKLPHGLIFARNGELLDCGSELRRVCAFRRARILCPVSPARNCGSVCELRRTRAPLTLYITGVIA
jgi:hypothetical protein